MSMGTQKEQAMALIHEKLATVIEGRTAWRIKLQELFQKEKAYIWGTGQVGQRTAHELTDMGGTAAAYVDNNAQKWGISIDGIPCISPTELMSVQDPLVLISVGMHGKAVGEQLSNAKVVRVLDMVDFYLNGMFDDLRSADPSIVAERVGICFDLLADAKSRDVLLAKLKGFLDFEPTFGRQNYYEDVCQGDQYFQDDLIHFSEESVLVDCGAYIGDTLEDFLRRGLPFRKYIAYELNRKNYDMLLDNMKKVHGGVELVAYNCGVGERNEQIYYDDVVSASSVSSTGIPGEIVRMDDHLKGEAVSFIKMDIEGAEMGALRGAEEMIRCRRPDLAICVYHSLSDLFEIPLYIHSLVPEYRLYLRHHTPVFCETVCYAVV